MILGAYMQNAKEQAIDVIRKLPDDCAMEDIQYHLYFCEKVERGIRDFEEGRVHTIEKVEQKIDEWQRSLGQTQP